MKLASKQSATFGFTLATDLHAERDEAAVRILPKTHSLRLPPSLLARVSTILQSSA